MSKAVQLQTVTSRQTGNPIHFLSLEGVSKKLILGTDQLEQFVELAQGVLNNGNSKQG